MKSASSYLPPLLTLGVFASILWAILSMPPGLQHQARSLAAGLPHANTHHHGAYLVSWGDYFAAWRR